MTNSNVEGLPPLPDGYDGYRYGVPKRGDMYYNHAKWYKADENWRFDTFVIATRTPLWYPESWRDDMDNVFEVKAGEWPPCAPGDRIEWIHLENRVSRSSSYNGPGLARSLGWVSIVAIRIIERVKP